MTSVTVSQELDSSFVKGLRLLHSADPDAEDQLQQLWRQAVLEKYGDRSPISVLHKVTIPTGVKRENSEPSEITGPELKKPKLEYSSNLLPKATSQGCTSNATYSSSTDIMDVYNSNSDDDSDNDAPMQILTDGICTKCKTSTSNSNNKLVECVDCHKHYHQQCHFPPITDMDLSDPRFVWYCSSCEENISTSTSDKTKTSGSKSSTAVKISTTKNSKTYGSSSSKTSSSKASSSESKESHSSHTERKGGHAMKKRSMKKHDKKKK